LADAASVVVIQADNPDADSLGSALALEHILAEQGKQVTLYCGVDIPSYLKYLRGADRVTKDLPNKFDASILVDCSTLSLLEQLQKTHQLHKVTSQPLLIIDHHLVSDVIDTPHLAIIDATAVATGEIIHQLCQQYAWPLSAEAASALAAAILADSLGLTTENTSSNSIRALARLVDAGANLSELDSERRARMSKSREIVAYKGQLLQRIEYYVDNQLALVTIPWKEIEQYSPLYNPAVLVLEELRMTADVKLAVVLKTYPDGKITGKLRANNGCMRAAELAANFNGGGHPSAAGFKTFGWKLDELKSELIKQATTLLQP
jgi:phosphoesterase RecJ-like protein